MTAAELQAKNDAACAAQLDAAVKRGEADRAYNAADPDVQLACGRLNKFMIEEHVRAGLDAADITGDSAGWVFEQVRLPYSNRSKS